MRNNIPPTHLSISAILLVVGLGMLGTQCGCQQATSQPIAEISDEMIQQAKTQGFDLLADALSKLKEEKEVA